MKKDLLAFHIVMLNKTVSNETTYRRLGEKMRMRAIEGLRERERERRYPSLLWCTGRCIVKTSQSLGVGSMFVLGASDAHGTQQIQLALSAKCAKNGH